LLLLGRYLQATCQRPQNVLCILRLQHSEMEQLPLARDLAAGHVIEKIEKEKEEDKKGVLVHYLDQGVNIQTLNNYGQTTSTITSNRAIYRREEGKADLYENVVIVNYQGERLETEKLLYDEQKDSIFADTLVRIETPTQIINGTGMRAKADFSAYIIENIVGEVEVKEGGNP
ncbi:MAG: LPS export ABC transporter periplasmic protein LptC, partial [Bacteroidota bacterium]